MASPLFASAFLEMGPSRSLSTLSSAQVRDLQERYRQHKSRRPIVVYRTIGYMIDNLVSPSLYMERTDRPTPQGSPQDGVDVPAAAAAIEKAPAMMSSATNASSQSNPPREKRAILSSNTEPTMSKSVPLLYKRVSGWTRMRESALASTNFYTYFCVISMIVDPKDVIVDLSRVGVRETEEVIIAPGPYRCVIVESSRFPRSKIAKEIGQISRLLRTERYVKMRESHGVTLVEHDLSHSFRDWRLSIDLLEEEIVLRDLRAVGRVRVVFRFGESTSKVTGGHEGPLFEGRGSLIDLFERSYSDVIASVTFGSPIRSPI